MCFLTGYRDWSVHSCYFSVKQCECKEDKVWIWWLDIIAKSVCANFWITNEIQVPKCGLHSSNYKETYVVVVVEENILQQAVAGIYIAAVLGDLLRSISVRFMCFITGYIVFFSN